MNINEVLENEKLVKCINESINKTYGKFNLKKVIPKDDFYQESLIKIMKNIDKFNEEKSKITSFIPLLIMTTAKDCITKACSQSKTFNKLEFEMNNLLSLDYTVENDSTFESSISNEGDLTLSSIDNIFIDEIINFTDLSTFQKTILSHMRNGLNREQVAKVMGYSSAYINIQFKKAKEKIVRKFTY